MKIWVFIEVNSFVSGSVQFKHMLFKGRLYFPSTCWLNAGDKELMEKGGPTVFFGFCVPNMSYECSTVVKGHFSQTSCIFKIVLKK